MIAGHQKKLQVAIERLKRIQSGNKRLSSLEHNTSSDVLDPPAYQGTKWLGVDSSNYWADQSIRKSSSGENLYAASGPLELTTFQQPKDEEASRSSPSYRGVVMGNSWPEPNIKTGQQDVVPIQVHRATNIHHHVPSEKHIEGEPPPPYTFYDTREHDHVDGDATPTNERRRIPAPPDDSDGMATIRRPSAKVSPRIAPKPKPVAKIIAKTKRSSREGPPEIIKLDNNNTIENNSGSMAYSCSTLPRKFSKRNHREHIYDEPADNPESPPHGIFGVTNSSVPNSPAHHGQESPWGKGGKRAPPPPPKRTNSIKCNMNKVGRGPEICMDDTSDCQNWLVSSQNCEGSLQPQGKPIYANCVQSLSERCPSKQLVPGNDRRHSSTGNKDSFPPPPPISSPVSSLASVSLASCLSSSATSNYTSGESYNNNQLSYVSSDLDNPLNDIIQQLEQTSSTEPTNITSTHSTPGTHRKPPAIAPKPAVISKIPPKDVKLGDWQDGRNDGSDASDNVEASSAGEKLQSVSSESNPSSGTSDTNTLPFANENVGTIKQRNPSNKTSIVTVSGSEDGDLDHCNTSKTVDLNCSIFEDDTDTIKRRPKCHSPYNHNADHQHRGW